MGERRERLAARSIAVTVWSVSGRNHGGEVNVVLRLASRGRSSAGLSRAASLAHLRWNRPSRIVPLGALIALPTPWLQTSLLALALRNTSLSRARCQRCNARLQLLHGVDAAGSISSDLGRPGEPQGPLRAL